MKKLLYQTSPYFNKEIQMYGCLFISLYYWSPAEYSYAELNGIWEALKARDSIDSACVIIDYNAVLDALGIDATYKEGHWAPSTPIAANQFAVGEFFWQSSHFSPIERNKSLIYDVKPASNTIKYGILKTIRIFTWRDK